MENIRTLTSFSKASGCGCKLPPALLKTLLEGLTTETGYPQLLVGNNKSDDASVYKLNDSLAIIQTVDFFTPIVNDPESFGKIGAANAISDVYAMGGKPIMANVVLGFPVDELPIEQVRAILQGAASVCKEAGIPMAGGHTISIGELVFGLSVTGIVHPDQIKTNVGAQDGDILFLTKPLGTGMIGTGIKRGLTTHEDETVLAAHCSKLNSVGEALGSIAGVHAMTDVTGFGLYGHLFEMCNGAGLSAELDFAAIPLLEEAKRFAEQFVLPDNTFRNWNAIKDNVKTTVKNAFAFLNDPQTNGGLLIAVSPDAIEIVQAIISAHHDGKIMLPIGRMVKAENTPVIMVK